MRLPVYMAVLGVAVGLSIMIPLALAMQAVWEEVSKW